MKFLLDECMPRSSGEALRILKYSFIDIKQAGLSGKDDLTVINFAIKTGRILITLDGDFSNILKYKPGTNPGIIILRPSYPTTSIKICKLLYRFLKNTKKIKVERCLVIVSPTKIRIRR
ncbi:MAG: DUF5615 family PIN-like protein [Candidatus Melainabacteria bacterium]|nr:DUF5615 family PIN-like protein [Candidatus Melainabacteria bacterium]